MPPHRHTLQLTTTQSLEIIDLTERVRHWVRESGIRDGLLTVLSPHTTARITLNEHESELHRDMLEFLRGIAPQEAAYGHNRAPVDDRLNAHAHLLGLFVNASESIPVADGELLLGSWQSLFFVELDGPRERREVLLHLMEAS
ncbi:MAG: secondary thiamine-phosphate synthase enzyme YjbQ [Gemmatimonadaceae bacterium]